MDLSFLFGNGNTNTEIVKKFIDLAIIDSLKIGRKLHLFAKHIPLLIFTLGMIGVGLQAVAIILEPNKPLKMKCAAMLLLAAMSVAMIAAFTLATSFPQLVLVLSAVVLTASIALEAMNYGLCIYRSLTINNTLKKIQRHPLTHNPAELEQIKKQRQELMTQLKTALANEQPQKRIDKLVKQVIDCDKKKSNLLHPQKLWQHKQAQQRRNFNMSSLAMIICVGSAVTTIAGILIAPINPPLAIAVIAMGIGLDLAGLSRHLYTKRQQIKIASKELHAHNLQKTTIINEASSSNDAVRILKALKRSPSTVAIDEDKLQLSTSLHRGQLSRRACHQADTFEDEHQQPPLSVGYSG